MRRTHAAGFIVLLAVVLNAPIAGAQPLGAPRAVQKDAVKQAALAPRLWTGAILERCGQIGELMVGRPPSSLVKSSGVFGRVSASAPGAVPASESYASADGAVRYTLNRDGTIATIETRTAGMFTQRYMVIGETPWRTVELRYGSGGTVVPSGQKGSVELDYPYEGVTFIFEAPREEDRRSKTARVSAVRLHPKRPDPTGADHSCNVR